MIKKQPKTDLSCQIVWDSLSRAEWSERFCAIPRSNLLQSPDYGDCMARLNQQNIRRGIVYIDGQEAGLIQILEAGLFRNVVHAVLIDRAPLWFEGFRKSDHFESFLECLRLEFPARVGRKIRFIPEVSKSPEILDLMKRYGFSQKAASSYQTFWLDLGRDLKDLRGGMYPSWRNKLNRAERHEIETVFDDGEFWLPWLLKEYVQDRIQRRYKGVSLRSLNALTSQFLRGQNMLVGTALLDGAPIAAILIFIHGSSATYQIGYTTKRGREVCAHHLLLWRACSALKEKKVYDFDLGGVNDADAKGVKTFKEAMGGQMVETAGLFV